MFNGNVFNGMMGRIEPGLCRMTANGKIAIKTKGGYKSYNVKTGTLTNCANFVFNVGDEFFFVMPTNHLKVGDIILVNGTPRCVAKIEENEITAFNYENSTKEIIVPERHIFLGKQYMYGKIVSPMGNMLKGNNIMKYMMMSEMMKGLNGNGNSNSNMMNNPMGLMMMSSMFGGKEDIFEGMFDFDEFDAPDVDAENDEDEEV